VSVPPDRTALVAWNRYLAFAVITTGALVEMSIWLGDPNLAASWARQGCSAARLLGWWKEEADVPEEAFS